MKVTVRLYAMLRERLPEDRKQDIVELEKGSKVDDIVEHYNISEDISLIIKVNGRNGSEETELEDGDRVGIFPPVGGG